ncbi:hypothetical protein L7F22_032598 [Adiantum nelumboides]|nr:hypothetical protein [Adiantum nelumboides]
MATVVQYVEPTCFEDAISNKDWENAMDEEIAMLDVNQTCELVPLLEGKKAIGCKWVYKVKHKADGTIEIYKERLVAKGYAQTYGIDYKETFALVEQMATIHTVIAGAAAKGRFMYQMNVKNAFLQGELQEEVYVEQPARYEDCDGGFLHAPPLGLFSYDLIIVDDSEIEIEHVKGLLKKKFKMKDLGELRYFLGLEEIQGSNILKLMDQSVASSSIEDVQQEEKDARDMVEKVYNKKLGGSKRVQQDELKELNLGTEDDPKMVNDDIYVDGEFLQDLFCSCCWNIRMYLLGITLMSKEMI